MLNARYSDIPKSSGSSLAISPGGPQSDVDTLRERAEQLVVQLERLKVTLRSVWAALICPEDDETGREPPPPGTLRDSIERGNTLAAEVNARADALAARL